MDIRVTTIYKVYGCDDGGSPILYAEFLNIIDACCYAVANRGRIHYGLPTVKVHTYSYDADTQRVSTQYETVNEERIYQVAATNKRN